MMIRRLASNLVLRSKQLHQRVTQESARHGVSTRFIDHRQRSCTTTMATRQHHYVPKFYLRRFKSRCRRINLHNVQRSLTVRDASIRYQCAKPDYYRTDQIENALAKLETRAAVTISALCAGEHDYSKDTVRQFIAVQYLRTPSLAERRAATHRKMQELVGGDIFDSDSTDKIRFDAVEHKELPVYNLLMTDHVAEVLSDLKLIVVKTASDAFITSDNPMFKYNQYLEDIHDYGTTGLGQTGIQIFLPLSPKHVLVMYDKDVYDYVKKQLPSETDVDVLNGLQVISANKNLYFNDGDQSTVVEDLASRYAHFRQDDTTVLDEFSSDQNPQDSLAQGYDQTPNVGLNLSFLRVKRRAYRRSMAKRLQETLRQPYRHPAVSRGDPTETFSTRVARY